MMSLPGNPVVHRTKHFTDLPESTRGVIVKVDCAFSFVVSRCGTLSKAVADTCIRHVQGSADWTTPPQPAYGVSARCFLPRSV